MKQTSSTQKPFGSNTKLPAVLPPAVIIFGLFAVAWALFAIASPFFQDWNNRLNDSLFRLRYRVHGPEQMIPSIGFVDLTDEAVHELRMKGRDRQDFGRLVKVLSNAGVGSIVFDIIFPEEGLPEGDREFVKASAAAANVYTPAVLQPEDRKAFMYSGTERDSLASWLWHPKILQDGDALSAVAGTTSFAELAAASKGVGHINTDPDPDGLYRRMPLLIRYRDGFVPNLALRAACDILGVNPQSIEVSFGSRIRLPAARLPDGSVRDINIPVDRGGRMIVNFTGPWEASFPHYSFVKLLQAETNQDLADTLSTELDGFHLIISDLTISSSDYGAVPLERVYPRSGLHANILNSILTGQFLRTQFWSESFLMTLVLVLLLVALFWRIRSVAASLAGLLCFALSAAFQFWLFISRGVMPGLVVPSMGFVFSLVAVNGYRFFQSEREKLTLRTRMERYFAPHLISKIVQSSANFMSAQQKVITVLFSDISGFTSWCTTQSPERIHQTLNEYFEDMTEIVFRNEGTIDKFIGDGLMAFFGDPLEQPDHALRAVRTAVEMQQAVRELRSRWEPTGRLAIHIRIGINSGEVVVGDMGSRRIMAYTAIGSNVNLSSRLESNAPVDGILVSESIYRAVKDTFATRHFGLISAKGIVEKFDTYEVPVP